jgi:hypothetical protein
VSLLYLKIYTVIKQFKPEIKLLVVRIVVKNFAPSGGENSDELNGTGIRLVGSATVDQSFRQFAGVDFSLIQ